MNQAIEKKTISFSSFLKCSLLIWLVLSTGFDSFGQRTTLKRLKTKNGLVIPIPLLVYSPETNFGFGFSLQYLYRFKNDTLGNLSTSGLTFLYTLNKQVIVNPNWDFFLKENKNRIAGGFVYQKFPEDFYGIGNNTKEDDREEFTAQYLLFKNRYTREVISGLQFGIQYRLEYAFNIKPQSGGNLDTNNITGSNGYHASGLGLAAIFDSRDNSQFPFTGSYIIFSNHLYFKEIGSSNNHMNFKIDARKYINLFKSNVMALQGFFNFNVHDPPFKMLALLGGPFVMRGYYAGRFRDRHMLAGQAEWRFPIWWRLIGVGFFGLGEVAHELNELSLRNLKYSWGGGLRFTLDAKERINIRFDFAFGNEGSRGFYFQLSEAF